MFEQHYNAAAAEGAIVELRLRVLANSWQGHVPTGGQLPEKGSREVRNHASCSITPSLGIKHS
jgi:hypothetical protein